MTNNRFEHYLRLIGQLRSADWFILLSVFALVLFGTSAIYSVELSREAVDFVHVDKQLIGLVIGVIIFVSVAVSNYKLLENYSIVLYLFCLLLLLLVLFFGENIRGSTGWFVFSGISFQPVEIMKIGLVVSLATYFSRRSLFAFRLRIIFESAMIVLPAVCLVLLQPDLGSALILIGTWFLMLIFVGVPWRYLFSLCTLFVSIFLAGWFWFFADYQKARILTFFNSSVDPLGEGYNVAQAVIAIGSGGLFGSGLGFGTQSQLKFLPESHTDFIFAVIAEELGFLGVGLLLIAFTVLFVRIMQHTKRSRDNFTAFLLLGSGSVFFLQFLVNVGMNLGLFPVTGIGLPFVSYGGSSLIVMFAFLAIIESIVIRQSGSHAV